MNIKILRMVTQSRSGLLFMVAPYARIRRLFQTENTYDFDFREGEVPESDFTLSAFGLPEPKGMALPKSSRWYLWFIAGGVICLGVGVLSGAVSSRKRSSSRPPADPRRGADHEQAISRWLCLLLIFAGSPCWRWQRVPISRRHLVPA